MGKNKVYLIYQLDSNKPLGYIEDLKEAKEFCLNRKCYFVPAFCLTQEKIKEY